MSQEDNPSSHVDTLLQNQTIYNIVPEKGNGDFKSRYYKTMRCMGMILQDRWNKSLRRGSAISQAYVTLFVEEKL